MPRPSPAVAQPASTPPAVEGVVPESLAADAVATPAPPVVLEANPDEPAGAVDPAPAQAPYTVVVASFRLEPSGDPSEATAAQMDALARRIEALGYEVGQADVDMGARGRWRRVLAGAYGSLDDARREAARLQLMREFGDARVIKSAAGSSGVSTRAAGGR
jgi:hypothetical protein